MINCKNNFKIISFIITIFLLCIMTFSCTYATGNIFGSTVEPSLEDADGSDEIAAIVSNFLGVVQFVSYGVAVGMVIYLGIKYMTSAANERADIKSASIKYIMGAIIIAAASTLMAILWNVAHNEINGVST